MKRSWTAILAAAAALTGAAVPAAALAGPQYSAEEIIEHFSRTQPAGDTTAGDTTTGGGATAGEHATRGVFIGAAGFGNEAGATAAASQAGTGQAETAAATVPQADVAGPLAIPMTGANAGQGTAATGTAPVVVAGQPPAHQPGQQSGQQSAAPQDAGGYDLLITFDLDSARLTPQARENLDAFVAALRSRALRPYRFAVDGHTDATGPEGYNQALSERRAASVVDYLVQHGVESGRLVARGYGETRPRRADPEAPENRRVETRRIE